MAFVYSYVLSILANSFPVKNGIYIHETKFIDQVAEMGDGWQWAKSSLLLRFVCFSKIVFSKKQV